MMILIKLLIENVNVACTHTHTHTHMTGFTCSYTYKLGHTITREPTKLADIYFRQRSNSATKL